MSSNIHWNIALFISLLRNSVCSVHNIYWSFRTGTSLRNPNYNLIYCLSTNIWSFSKEMVLTLKYNLIAVSTSAKCLVKNISLEIMITIHIKVTIPQEIWLKICLYMQLQHYVDVDFLQWNIVCHFQHGYSRMEWLLLVKIR